MGWGLCACSNAARPAISSKCACRSRLAPPARRTRRPSSRLERSRRRQAPPCGLCRGRALARLLVSSRVPPFAGTRHRRFLAAAGMTCPPPFLRAVPARPRSSAGGAAYFSPARKRWDEKGEFAFLPAPEARHRLAQRVSAGMRREHLPFFQRRRRDIL